MIDGGNHPKRRQTAARKGSWVSRSVPEPEQDFEEWDFPGPSAAVRTPPKRERSLFYRPKKEECVPPGLSLEAMAYAGYWKCASPCHHIQPEEQGEQCGKCGRRMGWEKGIS